jgi:hypothetical protein
MARGVGLFGVPMAVAATSSGLSPPTTQTIRFCNETLVTTLFGFLGL